MSTSPSTHLGTYHCIDYLEHFSLRITFTFLKKLKEKSTYEGIIFHLKVIVVYILTSQPCAFSQISSGFSDGKPPIISHVETPTVLLYS